MEQEFPEFEEEKPKIYNLLSIIIGTLLGSPIVTAYMMAENYKAFERRDLVLKTWILIILPYGILSYFLYTVNFFIKPSLFITNVFIRYIIPLLMVLFPIKIIQKEQITSYLIQGGKTFGIGRAIFIGLVSLLVIWVLQIIWVAYILVFTKW